MELSDLMVFRTVVQAGGVTKAAARLHRVQSNVTARLKKLEDDLGAELFTRQGRGLRLAPAGELLLPYAERLIQLADEARDAIQGGSLTGMLRLGSMESTAGIRLPPALADFHRRYPAMRLDLQTGASGPLVAQVLQGHLDAALVAEPVEDDRLETCPIYRETLVIALPLGATIGDGRGLTLLAFQPGCAYRKCLETWLAARRIIPDRVVEMGSYHGMLGCVAAGMGIAMAPESLLETYPSRASLSIQPLPPEIGQVRTLLVWRKSASRARIDALRQVLLAFAPTGAGAYAGA